MNPTRSSLILAAALLVLAAPADAKRKKKNNSGSAAQTSVADWLQPQARKGFYIRASFDTDPSSYVGRFIKPGTDDISEAAAQELTCSEHITHKVVDAGGTKRDEYFAASTSAAGNLGIPPVFQMGAGADSVTLVRVQYTESQKMQFEIADAAGYEACCLAAPNQCFDQFVGEFLSGTGRIFYSVGTAAELEAQGVTTDVLGDLDMKDGRYWKSSIEFTNPVYFAFQVADNVHMGGAVPTGLTSGRCSDAGVAWDDVPPQSSQGQYFVGVSKVFDNESTARDDAMTHAKQQALRWYQEAISTSTSSSMTASGSGANLGTQVDTTSSVEAEASGVVRQLQAQAWCDQNVQRPTGGHDYLYKVVTFLPNSAIDEGSTDDGTDESSDVSPQRPIGTPGR